MLYRCLTLTLMLLGCSTTEVGPIGSARHDACEIGWSCAAGCYAPLRPLLTLGCAADDFHSAPPMCSMTDNCANAKSQCYKKCEDDHSDSAAQINCKTDCYDLFGNNSECKKNFDRWLAERDEILLPLADCLTPCEGDVPRSACDSADGGCGPVVFAQHKGVTMAEACSLGDDSACAWTCDNPITGFPSL